MLGREKTVAFCLQKQYVALKEKTLLMLASYYFYPFFQRSTQGLTLPRRYMNNEYDVIRTKRIFSIFLRKHFEVMSLVQEMFDIYPI